MSFLFHFKHMSLYKVYSLLSEGKQERIHEKTIYGSIKQVPYQWVLCMLVCCLSSVFQKMYFGLVAMLFHRKYLLLIYTKTPPSYHMPINYIPLGRASFF